MSEIIKKRFNTIIENNLDKYEFLKLSYIGGSEYLEKDYLIQHSIESALDFKARKKRAQYFNFVQPTIDSLVGFIYNNQITRELPKELEFITEQATREGKDFKQLMFDCAIDSAFYPVFLLVDSPEFINAKTEKERIDKGYNPYITYYPVWKVRDFDYGSKEKGFNWIIFDDSYTDKSDPLVENREIIQYTLWTKYYIQRYERIEGNAKDEFKLVFNKKNPLKEVPVTVLNWNLNKGILANGQFEDICNYCKGIYNVFSLAQDLQARNVIKVFLFPETDRYKIPDEILTSGIGALSVIPYDGEKGARPEFISSVSQAEIDSTMMLLNFFIEQCKAKISDTTDSDRSNTYKGRLLEMSKMEAMLRQACRMLERAEKQVFYFLLKWLKKDKLFSGVVLNYPQDFQTEDIKDIMERLNYLYSIPSKTAQKIASLEIVKLAKPDIDAHELNIIEKEIDQSNEAMAVTESDLDADTDKENKA